MAILIGTPGAADANSFFLSLAEAEVMAGETLYSTAWDSESTTDDQKIASIIFWSRLLSSTVPWRGYRTFSTQALAFPRTGLTRDRGRTEVDPETIPLEIKLAVLTGAKLYVASDVTDPADEANILGRLTKLKADTVELGFAAGKSPHPLFQDLNLPAQVLSWIPLEWVELVKAEDRRVTFFVV